MSTIIPKDWMKSRLERLSKLRHELLAMDFYSEIIDVHDGSEEFLIKTMNGKTYVMSIHHTFVSWYFKEIGKGYALPMYEEHFLKTVREYAGLTKVLDEIGQEHETMPKVG